MNAITFGLHGLKMIQVKFGEDWTNCLGGIKKKVWFEQNQNGRLEVWQIMA